MTSRDFSTKQTPFIKKITLTGVVHKIRKDFPSNLNNFLTISRIFKLLLRNLSTNPFVIKKSRFKALWIFYVSNSKFQLFFNEF